MAFDGGYRIRSHRFCRIQQDLANRADSEDAVVHLMDENSSLSRAGWAPGHRSPGLLKPKNTLEIKGEDVQHYSAGVRYHTRQESLSQGNSISVTVLVWYREES